MMSDVTQSKLESAGSEMKQFPDQCFANIPRTDVFMSASKETLKQASQSLEVKV